MSKILLVCENNRGTSPIIDSVFDALMPNMPQIVASYSSLQQSGILGTIAEYAIARTYLGATQIYLIYFQLGADGVWRIDSM